MSRKRNILFTLALFFWLIPEGIKAQDANGLTTAEIDDYKEKIKQLVSFLEFTVNTLGDDQTPTREKEIIINQSYQKIFRDDKVQIEDDLDENRDVITNKDVQAYLKDIDFFFKEVEFEFDVENIEYQVNDQGKVFFKVNMNRLLNGVTLDNDTVRSIKKRFIEINLNDTQQDLKIASIYTTRLSEKEELENWWRFLSFEWKAIFKSQVGAFDSVDYNMIRQITAIEELDISNNEYLDDLEGVGKLQNLKKINLSHTIIGDLAPLRNLTKLEVINCNNTNVSSLEPLKYLISLRELYGVNTGITDLTPLAGLYDLEKLHLTGSRINDLRPLENLAKLTELLAGSTRLVDIQPVERLTSLQTLDFSGTYVTSMEAVARLTRLEKIDFGKTQVRNLEPLAGLENLRIVMFNSAPVHSLEPLQGKESLERVYCDNTLITRNQANLFMASNPQTLIVFKSDLLRDWWTQLSDSWKAVFSEKLGLESDPDKEELARLARTTEIDLSGKKNLNSLKPLQILENVKVVSLANTGIQDLSPLSEMTTIEALDCSGNPIHTLEPIGYLRQIKALNIEKTQVTSLKPVFYHDLQALYCDQTPIDKQEILKFKDEHASTLVVYKTDTLISWWMNLPEEWKKIFQDRLKDLKVAASTDGQYLPESEATDSLPGKEDLHRIASMQSLSIQNNFNLKSLEPLIQLPYLKTLQIVNSQVSDLSPLRYLHALQSLDISNNPVHDITPLESLNHLTHLNIANTPVGDIDPISGLYELEELDCSGSQIRNIKALEDLYELKYLNISNTNVKNISPLKRHDNLSTFICFNTRISSRKVERFQKDRPELTVKYY